jgi:hypothetical protein
MRLHGATDVTNNVVGRDLDDDPHPFPSGAIFVEENFNDIGTPGNGNDITDSGGPGIVLDGVGNTVRSNVITGHAEEGILVQTGPHVGLVNVIGGDNADEPNTISNNGGDAIRVAPPFGAEIQSNIGTGNGSTANHLFIDLGPDGPGNDDANTANESAAGLQAPTITTAQTNSISGTGEANATVRVFLKASASPGELGMRVGTATADPSGNWQLNVSLPVGQRVAATQTAERPADPITFDPAYKETSELSNVASAVTPPVTGGGGSTSGGGGSTSGGGGSTSGGGPTSTVGPPSTDPTAAILAALRADLRAAARRLRNLGIRKLLSRRGDRVKNVDALEAGTVRITGHATVPGAGAARRVLVLSGKRTFSKAGKATLTLKLTKAGRRLLRNKRGVRINLGGSFTQRNGNKTRANRAVAIKRKTR